MWYAIVLVSFFLVGCNSLEGKSAMNISLPLLHRSHAIVFVHGTNGVILSLLDSWNPAVSGPFFKRLMGKKTPEVSLGNYSLARKMSGPIRSIPFMKGSAGAMREEGLIALPSDIIERYLQEKLTVEEKRLSAVHIAYGTDSFFSLQENQEKITYYTYGWQGLLDKQCRRNAAQALYNALQAVHADRLTLVTHSYGAAVALYLSEVEEREKKGLNKKFSEINVIMCAPPLEEETARFAFKGFFKKIYNLYSENDWVQVGDRFTTVQGESLRTFGACVPKEIKKCINEKKYQVYDIRLLLNNKAFFDHMGMWSISYSPSVLQPLWPLPAIVLFPILCSFFEKNNDVFYQHVDLHFSDMQKKIGIKVCEHGNEKILHHNDISEEKLKTILALLEKNWDPAYNFFVKAPMGKMFKRFNKYPGI